MQFRKQLRLLHYDYTAAGAYFITIVARQRLCLFGSIRQAKLVPSKTGSVVYQEWLKLSLRVPGLMTDAFIVMPNHIHGILWLCSENNNSLSRIIAGYKAGVSRVTANRVWQHNFYERIIRNEKELFFARQYIEQNPLRWELDHYYQQE
ncbi:hypothetical protein EGJ48_11560 [Pantoea dispersa]|uniref:transposase n=1 Tax=Pantoea dispersa TaxID=59814 RepID=UPI000F68FF94|nr:transposase [Pantoea dispersa]RRW72320.1 hypothetical protein EGJ48_11560 [Pantoea dispersa]